MASDEFHKINLMNCIFVILGVVLRTLPRVADATDAYASLPSSNHPPSNGLGNYAIESMAARVMHDITNNQVSAKNAFTSSSPECWMASINTMNQLAIGMDPDDGGDYQKLLNPTSSGSFFCSSMTVAQQDVLALELTNCQLTRANLQFYESNVVRDGPDQMEVQGCSVGTGGATPYDASSCFPLMSPYAFNLYNTILLHTKAVCVSLTEERTMIQKEEVNARLLHASSAVQEAALAIEQTANHTASIMKEYAENIMMEQREELRRLNDARKQDEQESIRAVALAIAQTANHTALIMQEHTEKIMMEQREELRRDKESIRAAALTIGQTANHTATMMQEHTEKIMLEQRDEFRREQESIRTAALTIEQMANHTESMMLAREREASMVVERMQTETASLIAEQARLQEMIASANSQLQPLSSIESYVRMAVGGFTAFKALLNFFLSANVTWVITSVPLFWRGRRYAYAIFTLGLLAEFAAICCVDSTLSLEKDGIDAIGTVRNLTRVSALVTLILSSLAACVFPSKQDNSSLTMESQMNFVTKLNESAPVEVRSKRVQGPRRAAKYSTPTSLEFGEDMGRTIPTARHENDSIIISNRNFKPRHRSRSPYRSSFTGLVVPVVTPMKPRAGAIDVITTAPDCNRESITSGPHCYDDETKHEEDANRLESEYMRTLIQKGDGEMCGSSSDESSYDGSFSLLKTSKKRTASELYSSSGDESHFFSANDDEMSVKCTPNCASRSKKQKKTKLVNVTVH